MFLATSGTSSSESDSSLIFFGVAFLVAGPLAARGKSSSLSDMLRNVQREASMSSSELLSSSSSCVSPTRDEERAAFVAHTNGAIEKKKKKL